jgi:hypothetical protein
MSEHLTYTLIARLAPHEDSYHFLTIAQAKRLEKKLIAKGYTVTLTREEPIAGTRRSKMD